MNIYQKIIEVMREVEYLQKSPKKVNGQYTFISHDQVSAAIHPQLVKHGIIVIPTVVDCTQNGNRTEVTVAVRFVNCDKPDDAVSITSIGYGIDNADKGPGKAVSYAYKYALLKMFCLETGDDPDKDASPNFQATKPQEIEYMTDRQIKILMTRISDDTELLDRILAHYGKDALCDIPSSQFETILSKLLLSCEK